MATNRIVKLKIIELGKQQLNQWYHLLISTEVNYQRDFFDNLVQQTHYAYFNYAKNNKLIGACAVSFLPVNIQNKKIVIIKTNLVCIDKSHRGGNFIRTAGWNSIRFANKMHGAIPLYWASVLLSPTAYMLIAKTFTQYYPHPNKMTPDTIKSIMQFISEGNFKSYYANNLFDGSGKQSISEFKLRSDATERTQRIVKHFIAINPEYTKGSAFICVVPLSLINKFAIPLKALKKLLTIKKSIRSKV